MKKILSALVLINFLVSLLVPTVALAQEAIPTTCTMTHDVGVVGCPATGVCNYTTTPLCGVCCLLNTIYTVTDWTFVFLIAIVVILVLIGGYMIMTAAGGPEKVASGRNYIMYALIGLAVALLAKIFPAIVKYVVK